METEPKTSLRVIRSTAKSPTVSPNTRNSCGFVSLVGAGPGDPELLTVKAVRCLERADVVLYDALVRPEILELAATARRCAVGKRAGDKTISQEAISRLMISTARRGHRVVRLKSGDPFVLGRGGEEMIDLARAGIPFEVIPGISSAIAAPELANIPPTHRTITSAFLVVSGHGATAFAPVLRGVPANSVTVIVLMGLAHAAEITALLQEVGWSPATPCAILYAASTPEARQWFGQLGELPTAHRAIKGADLPGTIVIGDTVRIAQEIATLQTPLREAWVSHG